MQQKIGTGHSWYQSLVILVERYSLSSEQLSKQALKVMQLSNWLFVWCEKQVVWSLLFQGEIVHRDCFRPETVTKARGKGTYWREPPVMGAGSLWLRHACSKVCLGDGWTAQTQVPNVGGGLAIFCTVLFWLELIRGFEKIKSFGWNSGAHGFQWYIFTYYVIYLQNQGLFM